MNKPMHTNEATSNFITSDAVAGANVDVNETITLVEKYGTYTGRLRTIF